MHQESIIEEAAREWLAELGYAVGRGSQIAPGEVAAERNTSSNVLLVGRLREAIRRLNPAIPEEVLVTIRQFRRVHIERRMNP